MNVIKFELRRNLKSTLIWAIGLTLTMCLFMGIFPSMKSNDMMDVVKAKMDSMPTVMLEMFNIDAMMDFSNISSYFAYCYQFIAMAIGVYGAILGVNALSSEENEGYIEYLYAKPISRTEIFINKFIVAVINLFIVVTIVAAFTMLLIPLLEKNVNIDMLYSIKEVFVGSFVVGFVFIVLGILLSTIMKKAKGITQVGIGIFFITYILGMVGKISESVEFLKYASPYEKFIPSEVLEKGLDFKYLVILIVMCFVCLILGEKIYKRRDFRI